MQEADRAQEAMAARAEAMLEASTFAVVGASTHPAKYGALCYQALKASGKRVYPVNPRTDRLEGDPCYATIAALPETPEVVVAVVPPAVTEALVPQLAERGIRALWMQPGAESVAAIDEAARRGIATVHSGPCLLVGLRVQAGRRAAKNALDAPTGA